MGDHIHEQEEEFSLVLGSPFSPTLKKALVGPQNITHVKLTDLGDSKQLFFYFLQKQTRYFKFTQLVSAFLYKEKSFCTKLFKKVCRKIFLLAWKYFWS